MASLPSLQPNQIFAQKYRVIRLLKAGGMGAVYEVRHTTNDKRWALKIMHPDLASNVDARERFEREAKIDGLIESTSVVSVIDAGVDAPTETPYLVMEFLAGEELGDRLDRVGAFSAAEVVTYLRQVARALDKAHAKKIIHRDLKPENLFLCRNEEEGERVKVLDFGIAKLLETAVHSSTGAGGTPLYMAPEQTRRGREIGPWTDIWALGLIAYTLLVGQAYWQAETIGELYGELLSTDPREPPSARAARAGRALPKGFDAWFFRCVDNDPKKRFARAGEAVAELTGVLIGDQPSRPIPETRPMSSGSGTVPMAPLEAAPSWPRVGANTTSTPLSASPAGAQGATAPWTGRSIALAVITVCGLGGVAFVLNNREESRTLVASLPAESVSGSSAPVEALPTAPPNAPVAQAPSLNAAPTVAGSGGPRPSTRARATTGLSTPGASATSEGPGRSLSGDQMETVMRMHTQALKRVCWTGISGGGASGALETVHVTIDGTGHVSNAVAEGTNGPVGACLEREIKTWAFPATGNSTGPVDFPIKFIDQGAASSAPGGGGSLSSEQLETVMRMHSQAVKRVCWTGIGGGGASSAQETVHVTIDGSGHVTKASAEGTDSPVGTCLEHEMRNWTFPPTGGTTGPVDFPFQFVSQ